MTTPGTQPPQGALVAPPDLPEEGARLWQVGLWSGRRWIVLFRVEAEHNEFRHAPTMFGAFVEQLEGDAGAMRSGPNTFSWMDLNVTPNAYNDHYVFEREKDARRYYEGEWNEDP